MKYLDLFKTKTFKVFLLSFIIFSLIYVIFRIFIFESDPIIPLLRSLLDFYLYLAESIANFIFKVLDFKVYIDNHKIFFEKISGYDISNDELVINWTKYLLFKEWSIFLLFVFWATISSFRKKLFYTVILLITHFISLVIGLVILASLAPLITDKFSLMGFPPITFGILAMISLLYFWIINSKDDIQRTILKLKINLFFWESKLIEILAILGIFAILKSLIIPLISFNLYNSFLLYSTQKILDIFNYNATIDGNFLYGENGNLHLSKWCLGIRTMFLFASIVYLTGSNVMKRWIYIISGLLFLIFINIMRFVVLFIYLQNNSNYQLALDHHDFYNYIVYIIIFILWVVWFEKYADFTPYKKGTRLTS